MFLELFAQFFSSNKQIAPLCVANCGSRFDKFHVGLCTMIILTIILMIVIAAARMTRLCTLNIVSRFCAAAQRFRFLCQEMEIEEVVRFRGAFFA